MHVCVCVCVCVSRLDVNHTSNTAFFPDNYNRDVVCKMQPDGWTKYIRGHVCYNPSKVRPCVTHTHTRAHTHKYTHTHTLSFSCTCVCLRVYVCVSLTSSSLL